MGKIWRITNCIPNAQARFFALMIARCRYATGLLFWPPTTVLSCPAPSTYTVPLVLFLFFALCSRFFSPDLGHKLLVVCISRRLPHIPHFVPSVLARRLALLGVFFFYGLLARVLALHSPLDIRARDDLFMPNTYCMLNFPCSTFQPFLPLHGITQLNAIEKCQEIAWLEVFIQY